MFYQRIIDGQVDDDEVKVTDSRSLVSPYKESDRHEVIWERDPDTKVATLKLHFKGGGKVSYLFAVELDL